MKLYHGTARYNEQPILEEGAKPPLCASLDFREAAFFALRKTPMSDLSKVGVVIEFSGDLQGRDFAKIESSGLLRDEWEIRVFATEKLRADAVWQHHEDGRWTRREQLSR